ncbi:hypothetical protein F3Y22_tig00112044pilonHSYRG00124 [Hibiscus syriacus]|uniref:chorismate mutase n=1 Tax=Hibiscus syriacus TaxID=106335 RepID=A0A6A2X6U1_HIBSY|nr:hypothetical protein F3Y22_tig00112044pilonHSYRG00124 [Hibiscus syriacus]
MEQPSFQDPVLLQLQKPESNLQAPIPCKIVEESNPICSCFLQIYWNGNNAKGGCERELDTGGRKVSMTRNRKASCPGSFEEDSLRDICSRMQIPGFSRNLSSCHQEQDRDGLMNLLTYPKVEESVKIRAEMKIRTYGQKVPVEICKDDDCPTYKINPSLVAN